MPNDKNLLLALEFVTEGSNANIPRALSKEPFGTEKFKKSADALQRSSRNWTQGSGIQGLGIGEKITEGKQLKDLTLRVYVEKKKPKSKIPNKVPSTVTIPSLGKVHTDVIEIGRVEIESFTNEVRPAMPGSGVGHPKVAVGTFGCLVRKRNGSPGLYILSNAHVLAYSGLGKIGDFIIQPGKKDGGVVSTDVIAKLADFQPFDFKPTGHPNLIDAAIAKVKSHPSVTDVIRIIGLKPQGISKVVKRGMLVQKVGRTTDFTTGVITDVNYRLRIKYPYDVRRPSRKKRVGFKDQVLCSKYTAVGDSGSIVLNKQKKIVGLHFAGSESASIFNRIEHVMDYFDIELG